MLSYRRATGNRFVMTDTKNRDHRFTSTDEFLAAANKTNWFDHTGLLPVLVQMIGDYVIVSPYSWLRPRDDWFDKRIAFPCCDSTTTTTTATDLTEVQLNGTKKVWQRVWGSRPLGSEQSVPYFAVEIIRPSDLGGGGAGSFSFSVGVSASPYRLPNYFAYGADGHSHVLCCVISSDSILMSAAVGAQITTDSLTTENGIIVLGPKSFAFPPIKHATDRLVVGVAWDLDRKTASFYVNDKRVNQLSSYASDWIRRYTVPYDMVIGHLGSAYPLVASYTTGLTFRLIPWTPPLR